MIKQQGRTVEEHNRLFQRRSVVSFSGGFSALRQLDKPSNVEKSMPLKRLNDGELKSLLLAGYRVSSRHIHLYVEV